MIGQQATAAATLPWVTQGEMDTALAALIGVIALGCAFCLIEWAVRRQWRKPDILPPPDRSARRVHLEEWEDTE